MTTTAHAIPSDPAARPVAPTRREALEAPESGIVEVFNYGRTRQGLIPLWAGEGDRRTPDFICEAANRSLQDGEHFYTYQKGIPPLRESISRYMSRLYDRDLPPDRFHVTIGGMHALQMAIRIAAGTGDEVIVPSPAWPNFIGATVVQGATPVEVAMTLDPARAAGGWFLDLDRVEAAITPRTRAIVTVSPNNPSGAVYPETDLRAVNDLCAKHGLYHINDEAYEYFTFENARHFSPASIPGSAAHTISLYSMSKAYGFASWRIGWVVYPASLEAAMTKIQDTIVICPPAISQIAAIGALSAGREWVSEHVRTLAQTRLRVRDELATLACEGLAELPPAQGALYFLLRLKTARSSLDYVRSLIRDHRVAAIPGDAFGLKQGCALRVAYGALDSTTAAEGVGRLVAGVRALAR